MCVASSITTRKDADHCVFCNIFLLSGSPSVLYASRDIDDREDFELTGQENDLEKQIAVRQYLLK